jgi:hypothetical protein
MPPQPRLPSVGDVNDAPQEAAMHPLPQLVDPDTLVLVLATALVVVVAVIVGALGAESGLARLRARRRRRTAATALERA